MKKILKHCLSGMMAMLLVLIFFTTNVQADEGTNYVPEGEHYRVELLTSENGTSTLNNLEPATTIPGNTMLGEDVGTAILLEDGQTFEDVIVKSRSTIGSTCYISWGETINYFGWFTRKFNIQSDTGNHLAYCAEPAVVPIAGAHAVTELNDDRIKAVMITNPWGPEPWNDLWITHIQVENNNIRYGIAHALIGYYYTGGTEGFYDGGAGSAYDTIFRQLPIQINNWMNTHQDTLKSYKAYVARSGGQDIVWLEKVPEGSLSLKKSSANPELTANNSCYSLEGAEYGVYSDVACTNCVDKLTTKADGTSNTITLNAGTYYVKETKAPKGYRLDKEKVYTVVVTSKQTNTLKVTDLPKNDPVNVVLGKYDGEKTYNGQANLPQSSASLEGAEYTFKFYATHDYDTLEKLQAAEKKGEISPTRSWTFKTNKNGIIWFNDSFLVSGDSFWYDTSGAIVIPVGVITVQETKAPEGYHLNEEIFFRWIDGVNNPGDVSTFNMIQAPETVIKGGIKITKFGTDPDDESNLKTPLENVKFVLKCKDSNDTFTLITDKNGEASLTGIPYGTYTVTEEDTPKGYQGCKEFEITIDKEGEILNYLVENKLIRAAISVVKTDAETGKTIPISGITFRVLDKDKNPISMRNIDLSNKVVKEFETDEFGSLTFPERLKVGTYYLEEVKAPEGYLKGELLEFTIDKGYEWEKPLTIQYSDDNAMGTISLTKVNSVDESPIKGTEFSVKAAEDIITPDGTVRVSKGTVVDTMVTGEDGTATSKKLYLGKYEVKETKQSAGFVLAKDVYEVELTYKDQNTAVVTEDVGTIKNVPTEITLTKYKKDTDVVLEGVIFSIWPKGTDNVTDYTTDKDGKINVKYLLANTTYCVQEKATLPGYIPNTEIIEIVVDEKGLIDGKTHHEFTIENDFTQLIGTTAIDSETNTHLAKAASETTIYDTAEFVNLVIGEEVTVKGKVMDKSTGEPILVDGKEITGETVVIASERNGSIKVDFTFDSSALEGKSVVIFEEVYVQGVLIAEHKDLNDENQTIHFPAIKTIARDKDTNSNKAVPKKKSISIDKVEYVQLIPGEEYLMKGYAMNQETGEHILNDGKPVTAETLFVAKEANGEVEVVFEYDSSELNNVKVVFFEELYIDGKLIGIHADLNDEDQTIIYKIGTIKTKIPSDFFTGVRTGDAAPIAMLGMMLLASLGAIVFIIKKRRGASHEE